MNLLDLLDSVGGQQSLEKLSRNFGLDASKTNELINSLSPALVGALKKQTNSQDGLSSFINALQKGNHQEYVDNPASLTSAATVRDGNDILGHLLGSKDVSRNVAGHAATSTGINVDLIKQALPLIAGLAMGAMSKKSNAGQSLDHSGGDLLGSLSGGDGFDVDDVLNLARKFF
ncbi:MAG: DUF937 domain-containing protein [Lysobacterales bacterium]